MGFAPRTGPDVVTRLLGQKLSELMKQPFVIDNRAGAGGQIAAQFVARSAPDGYNLLIAAFGAGTPGHFGAKMLAEQGRFKIEPVHFRATGDAVTALIAGDVHAALMSTALANAQIKGGKMRALATTAPTRSSMLPDVPTFKESGFSNADFSAWFCLFVLAGTPEPIIATLNTQLLAALQDADLRRRLEEAGFSIIGTSPDAAKRMIAAETVKWKKVVTATGFKGD